MHWIKISCILCLFGCFKEFRPFDPFSVDYLIRWKNFTAYEVNHYIYPVITYSYLLVIIVIFLITDFIRYKPIIILCGLSGVIDYLLIIFGKIVLTMQLANVFFAISLCAEVAYYTYIYAAVDKSHYQEVTSYTKTASLFGRSLSSIIGQLGSSFNFLNYHQLLYISLSAFVAATMWSFFLPRVRQSIYFHRVSVSDNDGNTNAVVQKATDQLQQSKNEIEILRGNRNGITKNRTPLFKSAYTLLREHFVQAYTNYYVIKWSVWWALSSCGFLLVLNYSQLLWQTAVKSEDRIYNGAIDFLYAILGAISVFIVGKIRLNWTLLGDAICSLFALLEGVLMLASSYSYNIWFLYAAYIIFIVIHHTMLTVASFEVAKYICEDSHGLIFGVNMFLAVLLESSMTFIIVNMLILNIRQQYYIFGIYFIILAIIYFILAVINFVRYRRTANESRIKHTLISI